MGVAYKQIAEAAAPFAEQSTGYYFWKKESYLYADQKGAPQPPFSGWKLRVSVSARDVAAAFDAVLPIVQKYKINQAKVVAPEYLHLMERPQEPQRGKMITVYCDKRPKPVWKEFCLEAEKALRALRLGRGPVVASDLPVEGSWYLSRRCAIGIDGKPIDANAAGFERIWERLVDMNSDPLKGFAITDGMLARAGKATPEASAVEAFISTLNWRIIDSPRHGDGVRRVDASTMPQDAVWAVVGYLAGAGVRSAKLIYSETVDRDFIQVLPEDSEKLAAVINRLNCQPAVPTNGRRPALPIRRP